MNCTACNAFAISREFSKLKLVRVRCGQCGLTEYRRLDAGTRVSAKPPTARALPSMAGKP